MSAKAGGVWGVVLAGGSGARFGGHKQYAELGGHSLVDHAVRATARVCERVAVVLPAHGAWTGPPVDVVVEGGASRAESVRRALTVVPDSARIVLLHAASHPLAAPSAFDRVLDAIRNGAAGAVPGLRPADVVQRVEDGVVVESVGRDDLVLVQSPAAFRADVLRTAYAAGGEATEDTELVTAIGETVIVVEGDPRNIHVTTRADLDVVACLLRLCGTDAAPGSLDGDN